MRWSSESVQLTRSCEGVYTLIVHVAGCGSPVNLCSVVVRKGHAQAVGDHPEWAKARDEAMKQAAIMSGLAGGSFVPPEDMPLCVEMALSIGMMDPRDGIMEALAGTLCEQSQHLSMARKIYHTGRPHG